jgi:mRNA interferase MazF
MPEQGDIVLIPIPFTDLTATRRRPVIVVSNNRYNASSQDVIVVAMTSNLTAAPYSFEISSADLAEGSLNRPSRVRVDKIYTLATSIIVKHFGKVNDATLDRIRQTLIDVTRA